MIKYITLLIAISLLTGCSQQLGSLPVVSNKIPVDLKIKTDKVNIIDEKQIKEYKEDGSISDVIKYSYKTIKIEDKKNEVKAKRTPTSRTFLLNKTKDKTIYQTEFIAGQAQYYEEDEEWYQIEYATTTPKAYIRQTVSLLDRIIHKVFATDFFSNASDCDITYGWVASWATAHGAAAGQAISATATYFYINTKSDTPGYKIVRGFTSFDTSSIDSGDTIDSATISIYPYQKLNTDNDGLDYINVYVSTPADSTDIVLADYDEIGTTALSTAIDITGITVGNYINYILNATGLANISKTGYSDFGWREGHDAENTAVSGNNYTINRSSEETGTDKDPKLVVVHSAPSSRRIINIE